MVASKLSLYNRALTLCGERILSGISEARKPRYLLDQSWDNGIVKAALEEGMWSFAARTARLDYDPGIEPDFGYQCVVAQPEDYVQTISISEDEFFNNALNDYQHESGFIYSRLQSIYLKYVSLDSQYGMNFGLWPVSFEKLVGAMMADDIKDSLTQSDTRADRIEAELKKCKASALGKDAVKLPTEFPPVGRFNRARRGRGRFSNTQDGF